MPPITDLSRWGVYPTEEFLPDRQAALRSPADGMGIADECLANRSSLIVFAITYLEPFISRKLV